MEKPNRVHYNMSLDIICSRCKKISHQDHSGDATDLSEEINRVIHIPNGWCDLSLWFYLNGDSDGNDEGHYLLCPDCVKEMHQFIRGGE